MIRKLYLLSITGFWLVMMSLLIQKEFFGLSVIRDPYEVLPLHTSSIREAYHAYRLGENRLGFSHTLLISNEYDWEKEGGVTDVEKLEKLTNETSDSPFTFKHKSYLSFLLLGQENETFFNGSAELNQQLHIQSFELYVKNQDATSTISGVYENGKMVAEITDDLGNRSEKIIPLEYPVLHSESVIFLWTPQNLRVGKKGRLLIWNPLLLQTEDIDFQVSHKTTITHLDKDVEVFVIVVKKGEIETKVWVSPQGETLKMETPTGTIMTKEPGWMIFDAMRDKNNATPDLPNLFSIPSNIELENHERLRYLKAKLTLPEEEKYIEITKTDISLYEKAPYPMKVSEKEVTKYLEATDYIQSNDATIQSLSKEIIGEETSALNAALKLASWVNRNVAPIPTSGVPSALQVLSTRKGDCNEYTALFTALSRAAEIPTRMVAGIVYQAGSFFYHAWPEVYLGDWVPLDPTFGQAPVDVTHIPLVEGNVKDQVEIVSLIGKLQVNILESK